MNGTYTGVVDRVVDGETAVILLEEEGEVIEQLDIAVEQLPPPAQEESGVLSVTISEGELVEAEYQPEETRHRRETLQDRLDRLADRFSDE